MTASRSVPFILLAISLNLFPETAFAEPPAQAADFTLHVSDRGWNMNFDPYATWQDDPLYLPGEFDVRKITPHPPSQGWRSLEFVNGPHRFTLPATVEEAFWGQDQIFQPYTPNEYYYAKTDTQVQNGAYYGVSWWWRDVEVPASFASKPVYLLKIRGARQRAEVYVNEQLCGYSMLAETAFTSDVSYAIHPGQTNRILVRITNPGGRFDWNDGYEVTWGKYKFQESHGFGGLDRDVTLEAHDSSYISDSWVLNGLDSHSIDVHAEIANTSPKPVSGTVHFSIVDTASGQVLATDDVPATIPGAPAIPPPPPVPVPTPEPTVPKSRFPPRPQHLVSAPVKPAINPRLAPDKKMPAKPVEPEPPMTPAPALPTTTVEARFTVPDARLWTLDNPKLYQLKSEWVASSCTDDDTALRTFGFRSFKALGIGQDAGLYLNDVRIRLYTAISWGFWGINGLWPTKQLAAKEVISAKQLGLNCLNFHRNIGKEEVLDQQDQFGLLRYLEPGGGVQVLGENFKNETESTKGPIDTASKPELFSPANSTFAERYEQKKILSMIRQFRSHPSVIIYNLHNEMEPNLHDPRLFTILREMHQEDPSRIIVAKSGVQPIDQVFFNPASAKPDEPMYDDGTGFSGWRDQHTVGGPGVWTDSLYQDPQHFTHRIEDRREIVDWGEMLGSPTPDNHDLMIRQIQPQGKHGSYDFVDHKALNLAYTKFLDKWNFRTAFPTNDAFYRDAGTKAYQFWGRVLETARLCESNDILTISGWESTAIENHSGLVDNLRNCKADPALIRDKLAPLLPVIEPRGTIFKTGDSATIDLFLLNETGHAVLGKIVASYTDPAGAVHALGEFPAPPYQQNIFAYPVKEELKTDAFAAPGKYLLQVSLQGADHSELAHNSVEIAAYSTAAPEPVAPCKIGYLGSTRETKDQLGQWTNLTVEPFTPGTAYDLLIDPTEPSGRILHTDVGETIAGTDDPVLYRSAILGRPENLRFNLDNLPNGPATVTLYFAEPRFTEAGKRVFDVSINDQVVLKDFDIFATAKAANTAVTKSFPVVIKDGSLIIRPSHVVDHGVSENTRGEALFNGIKVDMPGKTLAITCGGEAYTDAHGVTWEPYTPRGSLDEEVLKQVAAGTPLLILAGDSGAADRAAQSLAKAGGLKYAGPIPSSRAPWMGNWVFLRDHPSFAGLPVNEVMKGDYELPVSSCYGLKVDGKKVEIIAGYGRDHDRDVGAAVFTCKVGKGTVLLQTLTGMNPIMYDHWLIQTITWLKGTAATQPIN